MQNARVHVPGDERRVPSLTRYCASYTRHIVSFRLGVVSARSVTRYKVICEGSTITDFLPANLDAAGHHLLASLGTVNETRQTIREFPQIVPFHTFSPFRDYTVLPEACNA